jgi:hypothetical protein
VAEGGGLNPTLQAGNVGASGNYSTQALRAFASLRETISLSLIDNAGNV